MSLSVSFVLDASDTFKQGPPFWGHQGVNVSVHYNIRSDHYAAIQGPPAQLRALADALIGAAKAAEQWAEENPREDT